MTTVRCGNGRNSGNASQTATAMSAIKPKSAINGLSLLARKWFRIFIAVMNCEIMHF
jgi:hypothetical protein